MFVSVTVTYKGFSISTKLRSEPVARKTFVKAVFFKIISFG
jgi:hypothetical protein